MEGGGGSAALQRTPPVPLPTHLTTTAFDITIENSMERSGLHIPCHAMPYHTMPDPRELPRCPPSVPNGRSGKVR